jgi:hypothetical protein
MSSFSKNKYAGLVAAALGYDGLSTSAYRQLCVQLRLGSELDFSGGRRASNDLAKEEKMKVLFNLRNAFPGVKNPQMFLRVFKGMLSAYKSESHRVPRDRTTIITRTTDTRLPSSGPAKNSTQSGDARDGSATESVRSS